MAEAPKADAALAGRLQALDGREIFRRLEIALYGKADNTWSLPRYERVMAVCNELAAALQEALHAHPAPTPDSTQGGE